jgi:hypothetical protein
MWQKELSLERLFLWELAKSETPQQDELYLRMAQSNFQKIQRKIKLLNQHNTKDPRGRASYFNEVANDGIYASFAVSKSEKGTQSLIMAEEGLIAVFQ